MHYLKNSPKSAMRGSTQRVRNGKQDGTCFNASQSNALYFSYIQGKWLHTTNSQNVAGEGGDMNWE